MTSNNIDNEIEKCTYCTKILSKLSEFNKNRPITACKEKNGTPKYGNRQIKSFFSSNSSVISSVSTVNIQPLFSTSPCNTENDIDSTDPFNSSNESYDFFTLTY